VHPDGDRVATAPAAAPGTVKADTLVLVFNFFDELRRMAPLAKR
jgi:hypothetical protein